MTIAPHKKPMRAIRIWKDARPSPNSAPTHFSADPDYHPDIDANEEDGEEDYAKDQSELKRWVMSLRRKLHQKPEKASASKQPHLKEDK
jgi:hypothetical protein